MSPALIISLAAATAAFLWLNRVLPFQNVLAIGALSAAVSTGIRIVEAKMFLTASLHAGEGGADLVCAAAGAFAITVCARGAARALLWRVRKSPNVGLQIIGLATLLAGLLPFGGWSVVARMLITSTCLIVGTPWFIDKRRVEY